VDAAAHRCRCVLTIYGVGEGDGAEHQQHEADQPPIEQRPVLGLRGDQDLAAPQQHDRDVDGIERKPIDRLRPRAGQAKRATKITNSMAASSAGSLHRALHPLAQSRRLPLVVKLKMMLPLTRDEGHMGEHAPSPDGGRR